MKKQFLYYVRYIARHVRETLNDPSGFFPPLERAQIALERERVEIHRRVAEIAPHNPILSGFKIFSQADEDGIIQCLLERLPSARRNHTFIEIGCGNGIENNTHALLLRGERGVWIDGDEQNIRFLDDALSRANARYRRLSWFRAFIDRDNLQQHLARACSFIGNESPDFFSLDIDGNDGWIARQAIELIRPMLLCVEYNAKFPPPMSVAMIYNDKHVWQKDDYQGASLCWYVDALRDYTLVTCGISGTNAFFVHNEFAELFVSYPVDILYQPFRPWFRFLQPGHAPSLKWLCDALSGDLALGEPPAIAAAGISMDDQRLPVVDAT